MGKRVLAVLVAFACIYFAARPRWIPSDPAPAGPAPSGAKVSKLEAIEAANGSVKEYLGVEDWLKDKDKLEITSAELKFVENASLLNRALIRSRPRPAWVVKVDLKPEMQMKTVRILVKDTSTITVDAMSKKVLASNIEIVP
jgi:hypothetical protein